jgi:hypothetical protein
MSYLLLIFITIGLFGALLVAAVLRSEIMGKLRRFLLLTGGSAVGFLVGVILHNLLYAAAILTEQITVLHYLFEILHALFFLIATILCPLGFLIGLLGSIFHLLKQSWG